MPGDPSGLEEELAQEPCLAILVIPSLVSSLGGAWWEYDALFEERCLLELAEREYSKAFDLALTTDLAGQKDQYFAHPVAAEAGYGYIRVLLARGVRDSDRRRLAEVRKGLQQLDAVVRVPHFQTPVVLSFDPHPSLAGLSQFGDSAGEERLAGMDNPIDPA